MGFWGELGREVQILGPLALLWEVLCTERRLGRGVKQPVIADPQKRHPQLSEEVRWEDVGVRRGDLMLPDWLGVVCS